MTFAMLGETMRITYVLIVITCLSLANCQPTTNEVVEQIPAATSKEFTAPANVRFERNVQVAMRDGIRLTTDLLLPNDGQAPMATILIRTPYHAELSNKSTVLAGLLEAGYAVVHQHERGRYFSEGEFTMLANAVEDGWDTMDWITNQSWSNGSIGTYGCSSSAENQLKLAASNHPAHKVMVAMSAGVGIAEAGPFREQGNFWLGGVWQQGWFDYFYSSMFQDWPQFSADLSDQERQRLINSFDLKNQRWGVDLAAYNCSRMHLPMNQIMTQMDAPKNELNGYLAAGPAGPSWEEQRVSEGEMISIPGYWSEAIYDISSRSTLAYFDWNRQANQAAGRTNQVMRVTQGGHCSFGRETETTMIGDLELGDARFAHATNVLDWFDRWLKPTESPSPLPPAFQAYMGSGDWLATDSLQAEQIQTWELGALGTLVRENPGRAKTITYIYDPANPAPSLGGGIGGTGDDHHDGAFDQSKLEQRDDVIVFTSEALDTPMDLFGHAQIGLAVSSDRPDTDFTVKLVDVFPDGRAFNIGDTILRMRYRDGLDNPTPMVSGEVYKIELSPILLSRRIEAGHHIRVEVSSSNFPSYARNLNTGLDPYQSTQSEIANNSIHVGADAGSFIRLPVR